MKSVFDGQALNAFAYVRNNQPGYPDVTLPDNHIIASDESWAEQNAQQQRSQHIERDGVGATPSANDVETTGRGGESLTPRMPTVDPIATRPLGWRRGWWRRCARAASDADSPIIGRTSGRARPDDARRRGGAGAGVGTVKVARRNANRNIPKKLQIKSRRMYTAAATHCQRSVMTDLAKAFDNHIGAARALPADEILPFRLDVDLATVNIATGIQVVVAHAAELPVHLPKENLAHLMSLDELAAGVKYAAMRVNLEVPEQSVIMTHLNRATEIRRQLLAVAKGLAANGLVPRDEVDAIIAGRGPLDRAIDCVSLADLFLKHEQAIAGKHPITAEQIAEASAVGSFLTTHLRPANAPAPLATGPSPIVDDRNRLATLLVRRHARLQVVAHYFYESDWEEHVPPLNSRGIKRKAKNEPQTAPT